MSLTDIFSAPQSKFDRLIKPQEFLQKRSRSEKFSDNILLSISVSGLSLYSSYNYYNDD